MHTALQATAAPKVDLIINAFTLTGVALMCGEAHGIPVAGFCLQPTCIPSDDEDWHATAPATTSDPGCNRIYPGCSPSCNRMCTACNRVCPRHAIVPIDSNGDSLIDRAEVRLCTSHTLIRVKWMP